jgi:hypothetical protein
MNGNGTAHANDAGAGLPIYAWVHAAKTNNGTDHDAEWPRALVEAKRASAPLAADRD